MQSMPTKRRLTSRELRKLTRLSTPQTDTVPNKKVTIAPASLSEDLHLHDSLVHKQVLNHLFVMLFTSHHSEDAIAKEFYRAYRHLVESRPLAELPLDLVDKEEFLSFFSAVKFAVDGMELRTEQKRKENDDSAFDERSHDDKPHGKRKKSKN
jgi:hypothetical protein